MVRFKNTFRSTKPPFANKSTQLVNELPSIRSHWQMIYLPNLSLAACL